MKRKSLFLFLLLLLGAPGAWAQSAYYSYSNISHTYGSNSSMYTGNSDRFPERLFDNNLDTKYCVVFTNDTWAGYLSVTFESNDLIIPSKYVIYTGDDTQSNPGRNPKNWHIDAKVNESDNWTTIHTVTNAGLPNTNKTSVEYTISGVTTAYKYFRFYITDIVSGSTFQLQDFHFIATVPGGGDDITIINEIASKADWETFCQAVNRGHDYSGETVIMTADVTDAVTTMAGVTTGESGYSFAFRGTFDGQGHTLNVNLTSGTLSNGWYYTAPFRVIDGATIMNLKTNGTVTQTEGKGAAGLIGLTQGTCVITNCVSNVTINSLTDGDGTHGGFISEIRGNTTMNGCAFTGSITGSTTRYCGGFVGYKYSGTATLNSCVFAPTEISFNANYSGDNSSNFVRPSGGGTLNNCYYTQTCGSVVQGKLMHSITGLSPVTVALNGEHTYYNLSDIDAYNIGIIYNGTIYAGNGDNVVLNLEGSSSGVYMANHGDITGSENPFTLNMTNYDTEISALTCPAPTEVAVSDITAHEANVNWEGTNENYIVKYRTAAYINTPIVQEGFNESATPSNWTQYTGLFNETTGTATLSSGSRWYFETSNGVFDRHARTNVYSNYQAWLVTPSLTIGNGYGLSFDVALTKYSGTLQPVDPAQQLDDKFIVLISTDNKATWTVLRKWDNAGSAYVYNDIACSATGEKVTLDLSAYSGQTAYIAFYGESTVSGGDNNLHIDNVTLGTLIPAGEWQNVTSTETSVTLTGLAPETLYEVVVQSDCGEDGLSAESTSVTFTTEVSCPAPTHLTVSDITAHGATVSWDKIATQLTGDITYNYTWVEHGGTPDWTLHGGMSAFDRWTNEEGPRAFAFSLDPETEYDFYVRRDCGEEGYSTEVMVSFTTAIACPAPTNVNVSGISGHEAMVAWTGSSESYIVKYRTAAYMNGVDESFDSSSVPAGWTRYSGLVNNVMAGTSSLTSTTSGWNTNSYAFGSYNMKVNIYGTGCNYWLVTPEFTVGEDFELNFDLALTDYNNSDPIEDATAQADDRFIVLIYTNNAWTILREWNNSGSRYVYNNIATTGENVNINLSAYLGQTVKIAFYGESTTSGGDNDMHIDNVYVGFPIPAGEWQTITVEDTIAALTGLASETLYEVVIQGDCGEEGLSAESEPVTFTTDVACPAPVNLTVSDISAHGATVSWEKTATQATGDITYNYTWVEHGGTPDWTLNGGMSAFDRWYDSSQVPHAFAFGLDPETTYDFYVRRDCGEDGYSAEVMVSFTTTVACPVPSDITVSDITGHGAMVTWTGNSEGYYVTIGIDNAPVIQNIDFANGIPSTWNNDATYPWTVTDGYIKSGNAGVSSSTSSISVTVTFPANGIVEFDAQCRGEGSSYDVCKFLIDSDTKFTKGANGEQWDHYTYEVTSGQHTFTWSYTKDGSVNPTGDYFAIDNVVMKQQPNIVWEDPIFVENTEYTFSGLSSETTYFVTVQGDCGEEGLSAESEPITFTTDISCPAPTPLDATDITSNSAVLHWTGNAESYNVSYYKAYFFDSFESEEDFHNQWTVYKVGNDGSTEWIIANPSESSSDLSAHSGITVVSSESYPEILTDNWLISPQITLPNQATLKFWIMRSTYDDAQDEYEVLLSTTGNAIDDFTVIKEKVAANSEWTEVSINLSAYDGQQCYIAIRHEFTDGFFLMVDDFGIFGWSEPIATTENSLLIEDLLPETEYQWKVQANCGEVDGSSQWSIVDSFTTLLACPVPFDLTVSEITANGATIAWTGYNDSYNVWVGQLEMASTNYDFEGNTISADFTNSTSYPWATTSNDKHSGTYSVKSGGTGTNSMTSDLKLEVTVENDATLSFWAKVSSESNWDYGRFLIDGTQQLQISGTSHIWTQYSYELEAGSHTLIWRYYKDSSNNHGDDCFYVDDITIESDVVSTEMNYTATESPLLLNDATNILPQTTYMVKVKGFCGDEETEYSEAVTFTTLDENTKIFIIEGEWSNGDNWVPAGVPSIDENVILRAEATIFDVAEANNITIEGTATLTIEDGGQLKTNSDVTATMKKFIIGYGTDYVETNNGYYLMTLPTAAPFSAADAGLLTKESDYDLYSWDRTATDEEWQNNHDGIDLQNGVGFLYANRDDMEMNFTATLRNSSEPVAVTPSYDEVEHGGWNLCGNPFPCEAYITTDAEGMAFYRLVDNQLELIEGAIAPLEAFFVKATAAGQTFTISREAPAK